MFFSFFFKIIIIEIKLFFYNLCQSLMKSSTLEVNCLFLVFIWILRLNVVSWSIQALTWTTYHRVNNYISLVFVAGIVGNRGIYISHSSRSGSWSKNWKWSSSSSKRSSRSSGIARKKFKPEQISIEAM